MSASRRKGFFNHLADSLHFRSQWKKVPFKIKEDDTGVEICTGMLELLNDNSKNPDKRAVHTVRANYLTSLKRYDEAVEDHARAVEFCRRKKDKFEAGESEKRMRRVNNLKAYAALEPSSLKAVRWMNMPNPSNLHDMRSYSEEKLHQLLAFLGDPDAELRARANELVAAIPFVTNRSLVDWLISFYRRNLVGGDRHAAVRALRQLGRMMFMAPGEEIPVEVALIKWGVASAFTCGGCAFCGYINTGIPIPPKGQFTPWYAQKEDRGAYTVPAICDHCNREFYLVWDRNLE